MLSVDDEKKAFLVCTPSENIYKGIQKHLEPLGLLSIWIKHPLPVIGLDIGGVSGILWDSKIGSPADFVAELKKTKLCYQHLPCLLIVEDGGGESGIDFNDMSCIDDLINYPLREIEFNVRISTHVKRATIIEEVLEANRLLELAQEKKRKLAALVVHDLRNPMAAISGNIQLLQEEIKDPYLLEMVNDLDALTQTSLSMIANLLDVEEFEDGLLKAKKSDVKLESFFERYPRLYRALIRARGLCLEIKTNDIDVGYFDHELMFRVVENLLDNSMRYAQKDGKVLVEVSKVDNQLVLLVANDGPAIPESEHTKIFERYYRLEARREGARANRGLGLYFCYLACKAHGGSIDVVSSSEFPGGFLIKLPFSEESPIN